MHHSCETFPDVAIPLHRCQPLWISSLLLLLLKAVYGGTHAYVKSTSPTQTITVTASSLAATTTTFASSGSAGNYTLSGTVTALSATAPTGNVSFLDQTNGNASLGSAALDPATATSGWQTMTSFTAAAPSYGIVVGDLTEDGIPDIVTSNYAGTSISVFLGNGDGTYQAHVDYTVPSFSFGMALGDLNGDGIPDLVLAYHGSTNAVSVFLGNGDGTFQAKQDYSTGGISQYVALGDFNNDGNLDVVALNSNTGKADILLGNGDGTLQAFTAYSVGSFPYGLAVGDFNADGKLDVVVSNSSGSTLSVLLGNGDGTLQTQTTYATNPNPTNIVAVDLRSDGKLDLVVCNNGASSLSVFLGNGDGTFQAKVDYATASYTWGVAAADVNGDGIPDVVATSPSGGTVNLFQGNGDGTLKTAIPTSTGATNYLIALVDLNGDGVLDLALPNLSGAGLVVSLASISESATLDNVSIPGGGTHNVLANYPGDSNAAASSSTSSSLTGTMFTTSLALNIAPASATPGQSVILTAALSPASGAGYTAGGTVTFSESAVNLGSPVSLSGGHAMFTKSDFTLGSHSITATYSEDANFLTAAATAVAQVNIATDYSIAANPNVLTIHRGQIGTSTLTVTPVGAYQGQVTFQCTGLPRFATCSFTPASLTMSGNNTAQTVQFQLSTVATSGAKGSPPIPGSHYRPILALLSPIGILALLSISRRWRRVSRSHGWRWMHMLLLAAAVMGIASCGSITRTSPQNQVPLGTSTVTVTAAAAGGANARSATITITIAP